MSTKFINFVDSGKINEFKRDVEPQEKLFGKIAENSEVLRLKIRHEKELAQATEMAYETGFNTAEEEARVRFEGKMSSLQHILNGIGRSIEKEKRMVVREMRDVFPNIIYELVREFFQENAEMLAETLIQRLELTLNVLVNEPSVEVRLHPKDMRLIREYLFIPEKQIWPIEDDNVPRGGFYIDTSYGTINGNIHDFLASFIETETKK